MQKHPVSRRHRPGIRDYVLTNLKYSFAVWAEGEALVTLLVLVGSAVVGFAISQVSTFLARPGTQEQFATGLVGWLVVLIFVVTPYRID